MRKTFWVILLSTIVFLSGTLLGVSTVYQVDYVTVEASTVSEEAALEVRELQEKLEKAYHRSSIFFANADQANKLVKEYPYFRITGFYKSYPNRLIVKISEGAEIYAVESGEQYYILDGEGTTLSLRETHINELNGAENVILKGLNVSASIGSVPVGDEEFSFMLALCKKVSEKFGGIRSKVSSVEVILRSPETIYCMTMREGIKIYFGSPSERMEEKVERALNEYLFLSNEEKLPGYLLVSENEEGILIRHFKTGDFQA